MSDWDFVGSKERIQAIVHATLKKRRDKKGFDYPGDAVDHICDKLENIKSLTRLMQTIEDRIWDLEQRVTRGSAQTVE